MKTDLHNAIRLELCLSRQDRLSYLLLGVAVALLCVALIQPAHAQVASRQPPRLSISSPASSGGDFRLVIEGEPNQNYVLHASTNLESWVSLSTNRTDSDGAVQVTDSSAARFSSRFYRAFLHTETPSSDTIWFDDAVPAGATPEGGGGDNSQWDWATNNPAPFSGTRAHQSSLVSGEHYHYFSGASATLNVQSGDVLFTYIYLDPAHLPSSILLEWYDGSWEHRAYWGANRYSYGTDGTASRRFMGPIPAAGQWVRLEVPASLVDFEGRTASGMAFSLWDGQATWDYSGKSTVLDPRPIVTVTAGDGVAAEAGPDSGTFTFTRTGDTTSALTVNYTLGGTAENGTDYEQLETSVTISAGSSSAALALTPIDDAAAEGSETVVLTLLEDAAYRLTSSARSATVTIRDDDQPPSMETVWFDDAVPLGATTFGGGGDNSQWDWVTENPAPFSGRAAHQSSLASGDHYHYFNGASARLNVQSGDVLFTYLYLDPAYLPSAILLEWYDGNNWEHRAYWGANRFSYGTDGTASRRFMGPIPAAGQWVRLEVPASLVNFEGRTASGMVFELWDGQATWDYSGKSTPSPLPTVTVIASDDTAAEEGPDSGTFTFVRTGDTTSALTVNYIVGGTADNGSDYQQLGTSVTIPAGSSSAAVIVTPIDDSTVETNETVILTLSTNAAYTVGSPDSATITIADNDQPPQEVVIWLEELQPNASEAGRVSGVIRFHRTGGDLNQPLQVNWTFTGTASNGVDFDQLPTTSPFPQGESVADLPITPIDDAEVEGNETVIVTLVDGPGYTVGSPSSATITIADNDEPPPPPLPSVMVTASDDAAAEAGPDSGTFTFTRTGDTTSALTVNYTLGGTADNGSDYEQLGSSVTIPAGSSSADVTVTPIDDSTVETNETVILTLSSNAAYTVGSPGSAMITIADNDEPPPPLPTVTVIASDDAAAEEGPGSGTFTFVRTGDTTSALTVNYTLGGTADNGSDYQPLETSVTIPAGSSSADVTVTPIDDSTVETNETVILTLSSNAAYTIGSPKQATITITDNDQPPPPLPTVTVIASDDAASEEGPDSGTFTVTRTGDTTSALTVNYTLGGTAQKGTDYEHLGTSVTLPAGSSSADVTITPIDDSTVETNETVILTLSSNAAYTIGSPNQATITIIDNDQPPPPPPPTVTVVALVPLAAELGPVDGTFTVSRSGSTSVALAVNYTMGGTAQNGVDYQTLPGSVTIPAGSSSVTITLTPIDDSTAEGSETAVLSLSADAAYTLGSPRSATVTIADDDQPLPEAPPPPTVTVTATQTLATLLTPGVFKITRSGSTGAPLTVNYTMGGTARNGTDYQTLSGTAVIPSGSSSTTVLVRPRTSLSLLKRVILTISPRSTYTVGSPSSATVTIPASIGLGLP